jgi:two-component system sensor histidine kinase UhpB
MPPAPPTSEAGELAITFNEMLARLEAERREATGRVLDGQEAERLRIAQELHDQIGQELTAVLLALARVERRVPDALRQDVLEVQDAVRGSLEDLRRIAIELRPEALDDLGLESALAVLCERFAERSGLEVSQRIAPGLPILTPETELVVYRVAQEALTNVARHSGVATAELDLAHGDGTLTLTVIDAGDGLPQGHRPGTGIRGMSERAALIGATLTIEDASPPGGCRVRLEVPLDELEELDGFETLDELEPSHEIGDAR